MAFRRTVSQTLNDLLYKKKEKDSKTITRVITRFNAEHRRISNIIEKHWHLLHEDDQLAQFLSPWPSITYKKVTSIKDRLVHSDFSSGSVIKEIAPKSLWKCGKCRLCAWIEEGEGFMLANGKLHRLRSHITCQSMGIAYLMICICGCSM